MSNDALVAAKALASNTRISLGLIPGLGMFIMLRMAIHLYRPDIEDAENRVRDHPFEQLHECYDFIIVGGGSAGAVVASRLSENPDWKVLLLEAGQDENVLADVPVMFPALQISSLDWQFETEPNEGYCLSMIAGKCKWPRGKVLGGSSVLNAMLYIRGNKRDYDNWERMGNVGWAYKDVFKYFIKSEDIRIPEHQGDPYHGTGGPLTIEYFAYSQPITNKLLEAGEQLGYNILDVNGEFQTGFTRSQATVRDGLRCSSAKAFLRPASKRSNLHVSVNSFVEKILIDEHKTAYGVKFVKNGQYRIVKASKEVILSAGSIQSPQILMLSGIGDAEHLKEFGIYPIVNLPGVGQNLQDHVAMGGHSFLFDNPYTNGSDYCFNLNTAISLGSIIDFNIHKKGMLYSMMEAEAMAFVNSKYQDPNEDHPDIQLFLAPTADNMDGGFFGKRANGLTDETYATLYEDILYMSSFSIVPLVLRPKSRGYVKLRDANPHTPPVIVPNYFSDPDDMAILIEGARIAQELANQPALKELNARPNPQRNPGCTDHELMSNEHLECQARHHTFTIYHPVGTCMMGPVDNLAAVVDSRLRVYGVKGLRVVDGSIMPTITSGNTNAPIIMIAEKASDMINEDWYDFPNDHFSNCPVEYQKHSKNSEDDSSEATLNLLNETANLFTCFKGEKEKADIPNIKTTKFDKDENKTKISLLPQDHETRNTGILPETDEAVYNDLNTNPFQPNYEYGIANYPAIKPSYTYPSKIYPYWYPTIIPGQLLPMPGNVAKILYPNSYNPNIGPTFTEYEQNPYKDMYFNKNNDYNPYIRPTFSEYEQNPYKDMYFNKNNNYNPNIGPTFTEYEQYPYKDTYFDTNNNYNSNIGPTFTEYEQNPFKDMYFNTNNQRKKLKSNKNKLFGNNFNLAKFKNNNKKTLYYETDGKTPKSGKSLWFYYDGIKYEVIL